MLDLNKPIRRKSDHSTATILASNVLAEIPGLRDATGRREGDTLLVKIAGDSQLQYYRPDGQFQSYKSLRDLENVPESVVSTRWARVLANGNVATSAVRRPTYDTPIVFTVEDGKITEVALGEK